jgi:D-alanyl-D-alanine carboxypeptidase
MATTLFAKQLNEKLSQSIYANFEKRINNDNSANTGILLVHSTSLGIHLKTAANPDSTVFVHPDQPYHFASIGKTVTSVLIAILYEKGLVSFDDFISKYLDAAVLERLHVYKGVDYSNEIRIRHLLNHSSGLPDPYADKNNQKISLMDRMIAKPDTFWTPIETINWGKQQLRPKFRPGKGFHYSDSNYELLGLIVEKITGMKFHEALHQFIFNPLEMDNSCLLFHSEPKVKSLYPMVDLCYKGLNLSKSQSISMSCAAGGIVSTSEDMLKFHKAIVEGRIIGKETFAKMCDFAKMGPSIRYGYGMMHFRFMMMPRKYDIWGNSGSIGAFMYYNPAMDVYVIGSFHKMGYQVQPIFCIFNLLKKINKQQVRQKKQLSSNL